MPHDPHPHSGSEPDFSPEHSTPHIAPIQTGGPLRRVLPWVLSAAAVLSLMLVMLFLVLPRLSQVPRRPGSPPVPSTATALPPAAGPDLPAPPQTPAANAPAVFAPLAVTLYSTGSGKHVPVGKPVLISAYASLPPNGSATIAISCTRNGGPRSLLTLAQGSLSTESWTPALPGRYDFTASALDSRKISAFSRHITITADAALATAGPPPTPVISPSPVPAIRQEKPSLHRLAARPFPAHPFPARPFPARPFPAVRPAPKMTPPAKQVRPPKSVPSKALHVAAAEFAVQPVAETLAGALRRRGFHAFVRVNTKPHHKPTYVVETGKFLRPADAKKQLYTLNHDGYPAFISR